MSLRSSLLTACGWVVLTHCGSDAGVSEGGSAGVTTQQIQDGQVDSGDPAVGLIWFADGGFCTGTLIAPNVVLTAAHCTLDNVEGFYTGKGSAATDISAPPSNMVRHAATKWVHHPDYEGGSCPNLTPDVGLILLAQPITNIGTVAYNNGAAPKAGDVCDVVGFGTHTTSAGDTYGQKRKGNSTVVDAPAKTYISVTLKSALADSGDSGGPLMEGGVIVGTTSCHTDGAWPQHQTEHYARIDTAADWIASVVTSWK